ncbi:unnamed protein product [Dicrocoelium dendriticum]|nr:unnamed protein product [Dicrocoelium dendriticum]
MFSTSALCVALVLFWNCELANSLVFNEPLSVGNLLQAPEQTAEAGKRANQGLDKRQRKQQVPSTFMNNGW